MSDLTDIARVQYNPNTEDFSILCIIADGFEVKNFYWQTGYKDLWSATAYAAEMVPADLLIDYHAAWPCTYVEALAITMRSVLQVAMTLKREDYQHMHGLLSRLMREYKPLRRAQIEHTRTVPLSQAQTAVRAPERVARPMVNHNAETAVPAPARMHVPGLAVDPRTLAEDADTEPVAPPREVRPSRTA